MGCPLGVSRIFHEQIYICNGMREERLCLYQDREGENGTQIESFAILFLSLVIQRWDSTKLLVEKGIFTKEEFLKMVSKVNNEAKKKVSKNA